MRNKVLKVHADDNVIVALTDLKAGEKVQFEGEEYMLTTDVNAKHKFAQHKFEVGDEIIMYGVLVGKAKAPIAKGEWISVFNINHASADFKVGERTLDWTKPDVSKFEERNFLGYHRLDGSVGTANYWIVLPMVFCENRNLDVMKDALVDKLGYSGNKKYQSQADELISLYRAGKSVEDILSSEFDSTFSENPADRLFPNIDGVKFLNHDLGCGGTKADAQALCGLLAGYITHPNVAGATVLSLGCQHAQYNMLEEEIEKRGGAKKPVYFLEQQELGTEEAVISNAIKKTFVGLIEANKETRQPAPLSKLVIGLECGGSDGFSGISANPAIGYTSDLLVALGGTVILAEFPELCGVEQEMGNRCVTDGLAARFNQIMTDYNQRAEDVGSGFYMNPSPGNVKDGLITDAIKSAGAAKKGGTSPVTDVLDYPEKVTKAGLNLLCTPGNDVESTTAEVGSGANIVLFTTGLGTPTGNPIAPVIKLSTNTKLYNKMPDIIDINTGTIIEGEESIPEVGERILDYVIKVASGEEQPWAVKNNQEDFIPWKRGVSL